MRKMKVKSPEKETATTASEEDQESSLRGVPSVGTRGGQGRGPSVCAPLGGEPRREPPEPRQDLHGGCMVPMDAGGQ